ncbi:unnamed protein product, partial [Gongylonema pulchrum]|uniref:US34 n=1 Tax=Gongylonema pulchrum TaxID=637853 RepID=A0A183EID8_9BILA
DAWGRAALRCQGALDVLIHWLAEGPCQQKEVIVNSLRWFIHDSIGLNYIACGTQFLDVALRHINGFLDQNGRRCQDHYVGNPFNRRKVEAGGKAVLEVCTQIKNYAHVTCSCCAEVRESRYRSDVYNRSAGNAHARASSVSPPRSPSPAFHLGSPSRMDEYIESLERPCLTQDENLRMDATHLNTYTRIIFLVNALFLVQMTVLFRMQRIGPHEL